MNANRTPAATNARLTLVLRWALVFALGVLLVSMATGQAGIANYMELKDNRDELQSVVRELAIENQMLEGQIARLKTSREAQIRYIKQEYGYVEKDEYVYRFQSQNAGQKARKQASETIAVRRRPRI